MKFYCEQCNTKYSIAEEKVRGKVLKVRCKNCGNIITVRDPQSPAPADASRKASPAAPPKPPGVPARVPQTNWYYSVNGQSSAPMDLAVLQSKYESGELGDETYVWHETIVQWKPVRDVEIFAESLAKGQVIKPRAKTVGFTGPLEAIKAADAPKGPQAGVAPTAQRTPESRPKLATPDPRPKPEPEPREDRLEKLREKLKNDVPATASTPAPVLRNLRPKNPCWKRRWTCQNRRFSASPRRNSHSPPPLNRQLSNFQPLTPSR
ncbi:MAG: GYF domain-containing protein [bacterium]